MNILAGQSNLLQPKAVTRRCAGATKLRLGNRVSGSGSTIMVYIFFLYIGLWYYERGQRKQCPGHRQKTDRLLRGDWPGTEEGRSRGKLVVRAFVAPD